MKILIIKPSSFGDIVHGLQVAAAIKSQISTVSIDWVVRDCFRRIVEISRIVDSIHVFYRGEGFRKFQRLISEIRRTEYDYVLDMQGLARTGILTFFSRSKNKIGRSDAREFAWLFYNEKIALPPNEAPHAVEILAHFLEVLNLPLKLPSELRFEASLSQKIWDLLRNDTLAEEVAETVLLFPESRGKEKEWPYFAQLADSVAEMLPRVKVLIVGQRRSRTSYSRYNIHDLSGKTSIDDMVFLIQNASLVVANDSAPVHIAAAVQTPVIALFGPTDAKRFGPYPLESSRNRAIQSSDEKMSSIKSDEVLKEVLDLLKNYPKNVCSSIKHSA